MPGSRAGRIAAIVAAALVVLLVAGQLFLPGIGERAIADRLTENGGSADVSLGALPAARLLWGDGDHLKVSGTGLDLDLEADEAVLDDLDRFGEVRVLIADSDVGPFRVESFALTRDGPGPYTLVSRSTASASRVAAYGAQRLDLPGAGLLGTIVDLTGLGATDLPIDLDLRFVSDDGRIRVTEGGGTVAGIPMGPLAELITAAIVIQL